MRSQDVFGKNKEVRKASTPLEQEASLAGLANGNLNLKAVELLMLSFKVLWPLNLVVPPAQMRKYQFIFKHLIQLRVRSGFFPRRILFFVVPCKVPFMQSNHPANI